LATSHRPLRSSSSRRRALLVVGLIAGSLLTGPAALAAPGGDPQTTYDAARAEITRIEAQVAAADESLQRTTVEAEAAGEATRAAQAALDTARAEAEASAAALREARAAVDRGRADVAGLGREAYMGEGRFRSVATLLASTGPGEFVQRAATLDLLGEDRTDRLRQFRAVEERENAADTAARTAVADRDRAAHAAAEAQAAAEAHLAEARGRFEAVSAQKASLQEKLRAAEVELLRKQGAPDPQAAWTRQQVAETAAARVTAAGAAVAPAAGQVTSCYGPRWGTMHYGVDFAAPIGTPIYAPEAGTVVQAGPASGFGLAVAVQHADGSITLYGHVNQFFVTAGQAVSAGQQIAEVGNRGQSTGPHLHFEVHTGGLYANRSDPAPWLAAHGISLGGNC
jgi:murein DD-endopeptidase MepM/ murein hydrolase activator NlpD